MNRPEFNRRFKLLRELNYIECFHLFKHLKVNKETFFEMFIDGLNCNKDLQENFYKHPEIVEEYLKQNKDSDVEDIIALNNVIYAGNKVVKTCNIYCLQDFFPTYETFIKNFIDEDMEILFQIIRFLNKNNLIEFENVKNSFQLKAE